jgi:hypothetical protein
VLLFAGTRHLSEARSELKAMNDPEEIEEGLTG